MNLLKNKIFSVIAMIAIQMATLSQIAAAWNASDVTVSSTSAYPFTQPAGATIFTITTPTNLTAVAVWIDDIASAVASSYSIDGGDTWSRPSYLTDGTNFPSLLQLRSSDTSGEAVAVWRIYDGFNDRLQSSTFSTATDSWSALTYITAAGVDIDSYNFDMDPDGRAIITAVSFDGTNFEVRTNVYLP